MVSLDGAPALMQQRTIRDGVRLIERDRDERVRLETTAIVAIWIPDRSGTRCESG